MEETVNQETSTQATEGAQNEHKTFTQEEVNAMFDKRFAKQYEKYGNLDELKEKADKFDQQVEASKTELQKAQERAAELEEKLKKKEHEEAIREIKKKVAEELKVPADLLTGKTEDECRTQAQAILSFATSQGYPTVKDGGESNPVQKKSTRDSFKEWAESNFS